MAGYQEPEEPFEKPTNAKERALVYRALRAPIPAESVDFRADSKPSQRDGKWSVRVVGYIDRTAVIERLNAVIGVGCWTFYGKEVGPLDREGELQLARGYLRLWDGGKNWDAGKPSNSDPSKGGISDLLKRCATQVGVGTYLGNLPSNLYCECVVDGDGKFRYLTDEGVASLRARLAQWDGKPGTFPRSARASGQTQQRQQPAQESQESRQESRQETEPEPTPATRAATQKTTSAKTAAPPHPVTTNAAGEQMATEQQRSAIGKLCEALGKPEPEWPLTLAQAREQISTLSAEYQKARRAS